MSHTIIPFYGNVRRYFNLKDGVDKAIEELFDPDSYALCPKARAFEGRCARYVHKKHALVVDSTVDGLAFVFKSLGVEAGDEIVTTWNTFSPVTDAILCVGAVPVYVDYEPDYWTMDPNLLEEKITDKTKLIVPIHTYGHAADMLAISDIARKHKILIVEECIYAEGALGDAFTVGEFAEALCFTSCFFRNLGPSGDAGIVAMNDEELYTLVTNFRNYSSVKFQGQARDRLQVVQSMIHRIYLKHLDEWTDRRIWIAGQYNQAFSGTDIKLPSVKPDYKHIYGLYVIETPERDDLKRYLKERGIASYAVNPADIIVKNRFPAIDECPDCDIPITKKHSERSLALPCYAEMTDEEVALVADTVREWVTSRAELKV